MSYRTAPTMMRRAFGAGALGLLVALAGCDLDISNPNAATEDDVLTTAAGLRAVAIGMQGRLGNALEEGIYVPGLVSGEIGNTQATQSTTREFQDFPDPGADTEIEPSNLDVLDLWSKYYQVVKSANDIIENAPDVTMDPGTRAGMLALAKLHKAIAFGSLIEAFEEIPITNLAGDNPAFADRAAVLAEVLALLASARTDASGTLSTEFNTLVLAPGLDLQNTLRAMQARYSLAAGNYADAITFANEVTAFSSVVTFTSVDENPLRALLHASSFFGAHTSFRTNAEAGDTRVDRFTTTTALTAFGGASLVRTNVFLTASDPIPLYTRDEIDLIRAEAHARLNQLPEARSAVNAVRVRNGLAAKSDAALATQQAILDEIFVQRTYSLFLTGLHWADLRRFGRIAQAKVPYLPYPLSECATNTSTPDC